MPQGQQVPHRAFGPGFEMKSFIYFGGIYFGGPLQF
jgi:hypothetical protein